MYLNLIMVKMIYRVCCGTLCRRMLHSVMLDAAMTQDRRKVFSTQIADMRHSLAT